MMFLVEEFWLLTLLNHTPFEWWIGSSFSNLFFGVLLLFHIVWAQYIFINIEDLTFLSFNSFHILLGLGSGLQPNWISGSSLTGVLEVGFSSIFNHDSLSQIIYLFIFLYHNAKIARRAWRYLQREGLLSCHWGPFSRSLISYVYVYALSWKIGNWFYY
jgi:hypothetical protein